MNVVKMQKQLEMMPDQSLATYMQQPDGSVPQYLILSELNRRKKLRDGAAAMAQGQMAPKTTVKEDLEQGIAALPAAAPEAEQAYAAGGLVSFAGGGDVSRDNRNPYSMIQQRAAANPYGNLAELWRATGGNNTTPLGDVSDLIGRHTQDPDYGVGDERPQIQPYDAQPLVAPGYAFNAQNPQGAGAPSTATAMPAQARQAPSAGGLGSLSVSARKKSAGKSAPGPVGPDDTQYKPISDEERMASVDKWANYFGDKNKGEFDESKQRLADAREELEGRKKDNVNQALIQAGLGIMAGKSQYALTNIGEGGMQGLAYLQKANAADDAAKKALISEQNALTAAQASARRGDQQAAIAYQGQAEKDRQFSVTAAQQRENYLLAHQDRQAQINATLQAASMRVSQGSGTKQDMLALKAAQMAEGSAKAWAQANKGNPEYVINPQKFEQDYQQKLSEGYTRAYAVIGREMPDAVQQPAAPKATMQWDPKSKKLIPIQ